MSDPLHTAVQGVVVGLCVSKRCLELGALTHGYSCVPVTCPDVPWQASQCAGLLQAGWWRSGFRPRQRGLSITNVVWLGQSSLGLPPWRVLAVAGQGLWRLAAFWLSKGVREGCVPGTEGNGVLGGTWVLAQGKGYPGCWPLLRPLSVQLSLLLWSLHLLPGAGSSLLQWRERLAGVVRAIWSPGCSSHRPGTLMGRKAARGRAAVEDRERPEMASLSLKFLQQVASALCLGRSE